MPLKRRDAVTDALRDRVINALHLGRATGGERLPPVRTLAREFDVNERVVLAALRVLADEGIVELRPRSGAYVAPPPPTAGASLPYLGSWLVGMLLQARSRGLAPRDVSEYLRRCLETRRLSAACIECNDDQRHMLCGELEWDHGYRTESVALDELVSGEPPLAAQRADLLVTTAFHASRVSTIAKALGKPSIAVGLRRDVFQSVSRRLRDGPVYFIATDRRFERKLRRMLETLGPVDELRVLYVDRDDLSAIPDDAPTFVMSSAREAVRARCGARGPGRQIQPARHFSDESARELLTFLVRANMAAFAGG